MAYKPSEEASYRNSKKYHAKVKRFTLQYTPAEAREAIRLKKYLEETGQGPSAYIKTLINKDLERRGA